MAAQGATLQNYNNELVKCVDDLKEKREEVNKAILKDVRRAARARPHRELFSGGRHTGPRRRDAIVTHAARPARLTPLTRACTCAGGGEEQDPERSADPDRAPLAHQRIPGAQGTGHLSGRCSR
jgi:hypothetical protein